MFSSGILTYCPRIWDGDFSSFKKALREDESIQYLFKVSEENHVPPSHMAIFMSIEESFEDGTIAEWEFCVKFMNVREFKKEWDKKYKK